jgi:NitT/TauT family transport system substrate-binding protein
MTTQIIRRSLIASILTLCVLFSACAPASAPEQAPSSPVEIKLAILPILETLPIYVAEQEGLFEANNLEVELIPVASAPERDQIIAAGKADGMINEALSTALNNKEGVQVQIVRYARVATPDQALFRILSAKNSGITTVESLKGVEIGVSEGTIIEYLTDRLLQAEGLTSEEIEMVAVPKIPDRMSLLGNGELKAAMLPEPLSSLAVQQGANVVLDDTKHPEFSYSVFTFRKDFIDDNPQAMSGFLSAIEEAVELINADPQKWSSLLSDQQLVPQPLVGTFEVPMFATAGVPTQAQWDDVLAWAEEQGLLSGDVAYQDSVTDAYLP